MSAKNSTKYMLIQDVCSKLLSLALTSLMSTGSPLVLQRIFGLLLNVTETLNDIMRTDEGGTAAGNSSLIE